MTHDYRSDEQDANRDAAVNLQLANEAVRDAAMRSGRWSRYAGIAAAHYRELAHRNRLAAMTADRNATAAGQ